MSRRLIRTSLFVFTAISTAALCLPAQAQNDAYNQMYGEAVHHYYSGDVTRAEQLLTEVLGSGSEDPRVHYFLGLCKAKYGGPAAGAADFEAGAQAEARGKNAYQIGMALQRIQGAVRVEIEKARLAARASARQQQLLEQRAQMDAAAAGGLNRIPAPTTPVPNNTVPTTPPATDPLNGGMRSGNTTVDPTQPNPQDVSNPFGDDPAAPGTAPATPAPGTAPADAASPFGAPEPAMPDTSNPFGTN